MISINPNYDLFIQILFVMFILSGIFTFLCGIIQADKIQQNKHGALDILQGIVMLILAVWVVV